MRKTLIGILFGLIIAGGSSIAYAVGAFPIATGGTGATTFRQGFIYSSGGTAALAASTSGITIDHIFATSTTATSTFQQGISISRGCFQMPNGTCLTQGGSGTVTNIATTFPIQGGAITNTGTLTFGGLSTTSPWNQGGVAFVSGSNQNQISSVATSTLSGSGVISVTAGAFTLGSSPISVSCPTCGTGSVTSITAGTGLNGGTILSSGTLSMVSYLATSTAETAGQLAVWGSTSGTPAKLYSIATSTETRSAAFSSTGTVGSNVSGTSGTLSSVIDPSFTWYATSTTYIGTTTVVLNIKTSIAATINNGTCEARNGLNGTFINVQLGYGTASTSMMVASSTVNTNTFTTNNTPAAGSRLAVDFGTSTAITVAGQLYVNCTFKITK